MRKIKITCLSAIALMAIGAGSAASANAAEGTFVVTGGPAPFTSTQVGVETWTLPGGRVLTCETVVLTGVVTNGSKQLTGFPTYDKCHVMVGLTTLPATFNPTECDYRFSDLTTTAANTYAAKTDVVCPAEQAMHIVLYSSHANHTAGTRLCEYTIDPQTGLTGVHFTDNANNTLNVRWTEVAFHMTRTFGPIANCGESTFISKLNGDTLLTPGPGGTVDIDD